MNDTATFNRRSKRGMVAMDDDESISQQPSEKLAKKLVEPLSSTPIPPSQELIEIQQRVIELEGMFQRLRVATKSAELRAERAETLLGSKDGILDASMQDHHKRVIDLSKQLEDAASTNEHQKLENSALKEELGASKSREFDLTRENAELKSELIREIKNTRRLEEELRLIKNERIKDGEKNNHLRAKLGQCEQLQPLSEIADPFNIFQICRSGMPEFPILAIPLPREQQDRPVLLTQLKPRPPPPTLKLRDATRSIDIFQLCRPDTAKTISIDSAVGQMRAKFNECGKEKWRRYWDVFGCSGALTCKACDETISLYIIEHFCSQNHPKKVRACGAAVSLHALQHWLNELQRAATGAAARPVQQVAAAVAAATNGNTEEEPMTEAARKAKDWADLWAHSRKMN